MQRTKQQVELDLIRRIAWSFYNTTGVTWEDLFSEASVAYCQAMQSYDPEKNASFTTWAWVCMRNALDDYVNAEFQHQYADLPAEDLDAVERPRTQSDEIPKESIAAIDDLAATRCITGDNLLEGLSQDAKTILQLVKEDVVDYTQMASKKARGQIYRKLRSEYDWSWPQIWNSFREIKTVLNN